MAINTAGSVMITGIGQVVLMWACRHEQRAGEKLFADYADYTYAEAASRQKVEDWIGSHVRRLLSSGNSP